MEAFRAAAEEEGATMYAMAEVEDVYDEPAPPERLVRAHLWARRPDRERYEQRGECESEPTVSVRAGHRWWYYRPEEGVTAHDDREVGNGAASEHEHLLDPWRLASTLEFEPLGAGSRAGRHVHRARGRPRPSDPDASWSLHPLGSGAHEYELEVDAERGVLLRVESRRDGLPFSVTEIHRARFDHPLNESLFPPHPPSELPLSHHEDGRLVHHLSVDEAAAMVPFDVYVLAAAPPDWTLDVSYAEGYGHSGAHVHLRYRAANASYGLSITQSTPEGHGDLAPSTSDIEGWEDIERNGRSMHLRPRTEHFPQSHLQMILGATALTVISDELSGDALVRLAADMVRGPDAPPV